MTKSPGKPLLISLRLLALAAMTITFNHSIALADDGIPVEGILAVNLTTSPTSPGIIAITANGIGSLTNVGNYSFQLQKTGSSSGLVQG